LWFDEFNFDLGYPIQARQEAQWSQGVWRRDFDNGIVLVIPRGTPRRPSTSAHVPQAHRDAGSGHQQRRDP